MDREEDVIVVEDSDEEMEIDVEKVDNAMQEEESSNDDEVIILEDSDYDSECSDDCDEKIQILKRADIFDIDELQKMCYISFYYEIENSDKFCTSCFLRVNDLYSHTRAVHKYKTERYVLLLGDRCCECRGSVSLILSCNLCPICKQ